MPGLSKAKGFLKVAKNLAFQPGLTASLVDSVRHVQRGYEFARAWNRDERPAPIAGATTATNPLRAFVEARVEGHGVWKWDHYHDIYHRHLQKFIGQKVHVLEVGVYSGGSLDMWRDYFGAECRIYGVDIEEACRSYEDDRTKIFIGDQEDRDFWSDVRKRIPRIDVLIDDGGHEQEQQMVTLEEMLPHLSPGGVYVCEDVRGEYEGFASFAQGVASSLNRMTKYEKQGMPATPAQANLASIHSYPFVTVIEKNAAPVDHFVAKKHGTLWQPFLDDKCAGAARPDSASG